LDGVAYASKRAGDTKKQKAVDALCGVLLDRSCKLVQDAVAKADVESARHLLRLLERNLGLKPRAKEKMEDVILRAHPSALAASSTTRCPRTPRRSSGRASSGTCRRTPSTTRRARSRGC